MKNLKLFLIIFLFFQLFNIYGQNQNSDSLENFYKFYDHKMNYFVNQAEIHEVNYYEIAGYKSFIRKVLYLQNRFDEFGNITPYALSLQEHCLNNHDIFPNVSPVWEYIGHNGIHLTADGQFRSWNNGQGNINRIWVNVSDHNHLLAGGNHGGLWRTFDGGDNWECISDSEPLLDGFRSLDVKSTNTDHIFALQSNGDYSHGLFETSNGGANWVNNRVYYNGSFLYPNASEHNLPVKWIINPVNDSIQFLITKGIILRSMNRGDSWDSLKTEKFNFWAWDQAFNDIEFDPVDPSVIYVSGPKTFRLTNNGDNILNITDSIIQFSFDTVNPDKRYKVLIGTHQNYPESIWFAVKAFHSYNKDAIICYKKNSDRYELWHSGPIWLASGVSSEHHKMVCEISPSDSNHIILGGVATKLFNNYAQSNKVITISPVSPNDNDSTNWTHEDVRDAKYLTDQNGNEVIFFGNDGGIFKATSDTITSWNWTYLANDGTNGIQNADLHGFASSNSQRDILFAGFQDMGCALSENSNWFGVDKKADGGTGVIDFEDPNFIYASLFNSPATFYKSTDGGKSWTYPNYYFKTTDHAVPPAVLNPSNPNELYVGDLYKLHKFPNVRYSNNRIPITITQYDPYGYGRLTINEIAISKSNDSVIYAGTGRYWPDWMADSLLFYNKSLFKTTNGGQDWIDITWPDTTTSSIFDQPLTGIAVNPWNENELWVCFGSISSSLDPAKKKKVYHSTDGGLSWVPMANGLPEKIPANELFFDNRGNRLYLANDVGLYYYESSESKWYNIVGNVPATRILHVRFNYPKNKIRIGTYGRGIWQTDIPACEQTVDTIEIQSNTTWGDPMHLYSHVKVNNPNVLTITNEVYMGENAKIMIEPGAKLILDGGLLTNACDILWQGIEVWGNPEESQHTPLYHGMVHIKNGGKIENAVIGVRAGSSDTPGKNGGIVLATDAEFVNNGICVMYDPYAFTNSGLFTNCTFRRSGALLGQVDLGVFSLVKLNDVHYVKFENCSFINDTDTDHVGCGIESFNSIFRVLEECTNYSGNECTDWDNGSFTNLNYGIYATAANATDFAYIKYTDFVDNYKGVYLSGMTGALVMECNFEINTPFVNNGGYGLYLDNSTGYTIEENKFEHTGESRMGVGLIANNSGGAPNEIYRNRFTGLQQGVSAQEINRNFMTIPPQGLQILCCEFEDCDADILVPRSTLRQWGIAPGQGANSTNPLYMAGNLFDIHSQTPDGDFDDINNEGTHFTYYYPSNHANGYDRVKPIDYTTNTVTLIGKLVTTLWTDTIGCPPTQPGGGGSESEMSESLMETQKMIDSTEQVYSMLVDGGNTESLYNEVHSSASAQTMQVYNELMGMSPYLSDTVVGAAIEKEDVIPGAMLRDIMVANPHAAKSDNLIEKVDSRFDPLPDYMKAQILAGRSLVSLKEEMESNLARYHLQKSRLINGLIHHYLKADMPCGNDSVINLLQSDSEMASKYRLAMKHIETGNTTQALSVLNALPVQYNLQGQQLTVHQEMVDFCTLSIQMATQTGGWQSATEAQMLQLYTLLQSATPVSAYARNALLMLGELSYVEPVIVPDLLKSAQAETAYKELMKSMAPPILEVHPNPAKDFVIVGWTLDREQADGSIAIRRITGELKSSFTLSTPADKQTIDTRRWLSGAYVITLTIDGKVMESAKFTLVK